MLSHMDTNTFDQKIEAALSQSTRRHAGDPERHVPGRGVDLDLEQDLISAIPDTTGALVVVCDTHGCIVRFNPACERTFGYTLDDVASKPFWDLFMLPQETKQVKAIFDGVCSGQFAGEHENHWLARDGNRHLIAWSSTALCNSEGSVEHILVIGIDVTERKQLEEAYRTLVEYSLQGLIIAQDFAIVFANPALVQISGYSLDELSSMSPDEMLMLIHPDDRGMVAGLMQERLAGGRLTPRLEFRVIQKDGQVRWIETYARRVKSRGKPAVQVAVIDITERKRAEEALARSEAFNRRLVEASPVGILYLDAAGTITYENSVMRRMMGVPEGMTSPVIGMKISEVPTIKEAGVVRFFERCVAGETISGEVVHYRSLMGPEVDLEIQATPLLGRRGEFDGAIAIAQDITQRRQVEDEKAQLFDAVSQQREQLRALAGRLAEVQEAERKLLAQELHDRVGRNLTALDFNLNIIRAQLSAAASDTAPIQARLDESLALVEQTAECIRDVMANLRPPVLDDYGLVAALRWYAAQFASWAGLNVTVQGEEYDPRLAPPVETALFRIAQEALTNVAKHAQATEVVLTVTLKDGIARLVVIDDGLGFEPIALAEITKRQGWGLLSMSERARAVGGWCRIESCVGLGTRVTVEVAR
jgi:PAS domain S-box-containing protein